LAGFGSLKFVNLEGLMEVDIGLKTKVKADQVFLIGNAKPDQFVLLYDPIKSRRVKRNLRKVDPMQIVEQLGAVDFIRFELPHWGTVWFRSTCVRNVVDISDDDLKHSPIKFGAHLLFKHDPEPPDEHAGFFLFGLTASEVARSCKFG
jgi:hypothetical protein